MTKKFELRKVQYMPAKLEPGILYVAEEFGAAAHLCACDCGAIVRTPLDPTEWSLTETKDGPSLYPSIGNWQEPCQSHYWIRKNRVRWAPKWSRQQIYRGRARDQFAKEKYFLAAESESSPSTKEDGDKPESTI